jgi:hypothetical protein
MLAGWQRIFMKESGLLRDPLIQAMHQPASMRWSMRHGA